MAWIMHLSWFFPFRVGRLVGRVRASPSADRGSAPEVKITNDVWALEQQIVLEDIGKVKDLCKLCALVKTPRIHENAKCVPQVYDPAVESVRGCAHHQWTRSTNLCPWRRARRTNSLRVSLSSTTMERVKTSFFMVRFYLFISSFLLFLAAAQQDPKHTLNSFANPPAKLFFFDDTPVGISFIDMVQIQGTDMV